MRNTFVDTIIKECKQREDIFIISGDAGLGVFDKYQKQYPKRFLNMGAAEQNMIGFASGLAKTGFKVYVYNIIPFVLYRCYEQVRNDICYQELPVTLIGIGSGVTYAPQGMTHYSVEDIGLAQTMPNIRVFSPIDPIEARLAAKYSLTATDPVYVRLAKRGEPNIHRDGNFNITDPQLIEKGKNLALVFHGSIGEEVTKARDMLLKDGITAKLISMPMLMPLDVKALFETIGDVKAVVTVEEHYVNCGLGAIVARGYAELSPPWKLFSLGIPGKFIHEIKHTQGMREHFGISAGKITNYVKKIFKEGDKTWGS